MKKKTHNYFEDLLLEISVINLKLEMEKAWRVNTVNPTE